MSLGTEINNPFDLRFRSDIHWQGQIGQREGFVEYDTLLNGLRAGFKDLHTAWKRDGRNSISQIVASYAPPSENNTATYIAGVCAYTGLGPDDPLNLDDGDELETLGRAIVEQEQGKDYLASLSPDLIEQAVGEALA